jgi:hypothetical protein
MQREPIIDSGAETRCGLVRGIQLEKFIREKGHIHWASQKGAHPFGLSQSWWCSAPGSWLFKVLIRK